MKTRLYQFLDSIRSSYWFLPAVMSVGAVVLSVIMLSLDRRHGDVIPADSWWLYGGGPESARDVLAAIVTSMISVTSVVFSITIVALTLAAGQFGSRVLRNFMRDRGNQITLGTFIATFIYAMLVLRTVRGLDDTEFVPALSMSVGILLVFTSVGVLIYFIHHVASSIQADSVIRSIARETETAIERLFPESMGRAMLPDADSLDRELPEAFDDRLVPIRASRGDYLQMIDDDSLMEAAREHDLMVKLHVRPGHFLAQGRVIAEVWKDTPPSDEVLSEVKGVFVLGRNRSLQQDAEFGIHQLVEVAVRSLSTGINDPFTAVTCVDRITSILCGLTGKSFPGPLRYDPEGRLRVLADAPTFTGFVDSGFRQIRQNATGSPAVLIRMLEALGTIGEQARTPEHRRVLAHHARLVRETGLATKPADPDRRAIEDGFREAIRAIEAEASA